MKNIHKLVSIMLSPIWFPIACISDRFAFWLIDHKWIGD